jgi:hypothetical protein
MVPGRYREPSLVEAGGQLLRSFRCGPDYAFIRANADAERVMARTLLRDILVPAPSAAALGESMSLYRAGLKLAFFLPLGVTMPPVLRRRRQASPM